MGKRRGHGEGAIYQRADGRWCSSVDLGYASGKRKRKVVYGKTRKDVADQLKNLHAVQATGVNVAANKLTVEVFLTTWLEDTIKVAKTLGTYSNYNDVVRLYIKPSIGKRLLVKLEPEHVQTMLNMMFVNGLSPRTCELTRAVLRRALNQALQRGVLHRNVATMVELPRKERHKAMPLSQEEARILLKTIKGHRNEALYLLELSLGLRKGEVLALLWNDVDFKQKTIRIAASLQEYNGALHRSAPKTAASVATLPLPEVLAQALLQHRERQNKERSNPGWQEHGLVFPSNKGTPLRPRNVSLSFKRLLKRAGLNQATRFHDLRHTCATLLIAQGVHLSVVKEILRHSQISITADIYGHVLPPNVRAALNDLGTLFNQDEGEQS